jgi:ELWxxDGT repeat protein
LSVLTYDTYGQGLWKFDQAGGSTFITYIAHTPTFNGFAGWGLNPTNVNGTLFFTARDDAHGQELWKSDGTAAGTVLVKDVEPGPGDSIAQDLMNVNGTLYFQATTHPNGIFHRQLWKSDGTAAGTVPVDPASTSGGNYPSVAAGRVTDDFAIDGNGTLFYIGSSPNSTGDFELWRSDGTAAGTFRVKDLNPGSDSGYPRGLTNVNGTIFFAAADGVHGSPLWKSDGTTAGTVIVSYLNPTNLTNVNGTLFFTADDGVHGAELWKSDGTAGGTVLVKDIYIPESATNTQLSANPGNLTNVNGILYFTATRRQFTNTFGGFYFNFTTLWRSDGTANGTYEVGNATVNVPQNLLNVNGTLFFNAFYGATGRELYKYVPTKRDYDRNSQSDLIWRNPTSGDVYVWDMNNQIVTGSSGYVSNLPAAWKIVSTKDFNRDGYADLLWRNTTTGDIYLWNMQNKTLLNASYVGNLAPSWEVAATTDFNNDGKTDILWNDTATGATYLWNMNNAAIQSYSYITNLGASWRVAGTGDYNKDGNADIVWRNTSTGATYLWNMNNATLLSSSYVTTLGTNLQIVSTEDFNGDGKADLLWRDSTSGAVYLWNMNNGAILNSNYITTLSGWTVEDTADYNADNKTDILWRNLTTGDIYLWNMNNATLTTANYVTTLGSPWQLAA